MYDQVTMFMMNNTTPAFDQWTCAFCGEGYEAGHGFYYVPEMGKQCEACHTEEVSE